MNPTLRFGAVCAFIVTACTTFCSPAAEPVSPAEQAELYGDVGPEAYLLGDFSPEQHAAFVRLDRHGVPVVDARVIYMRREAADALKQMHAAFRKEHAKIPFAVRSGTRNFRAQQGIWEGKWNGDRLVDGVRLNEAVPDPMQRALKILEFSSMPGTSRHHWGTDFDFHNLTNGYYQSGEGKVLYDWLRKNAAQFGFCQPYIAGRTSGYFEERWHWSYRPLSSKLLREWKVRLTEKYPAGLRFAGSSTAAQLARIYVESIDPACE